MGFDLTDNHGVANFSSSVLGGILKLDEAEGVCLPRVGVWGLLNLVQCLGRCGQVHWHRKCSKCAQTSGAYAVGGIVTIYWRFCLVQALSDFGESWLDIIVGPLGMG